MSKILQIKLDNSVAGLWDHVTSQKEFMHVTQAGIIFRLLSSYEDAKSGSVHQVSAIEPAQKPAPSSKSALDPDAFKIKRLTQWANMETTNKMANVENFVGVLDKNVDFLDSDTDFQALEQAARRYKTKTQAEIDTAWANRTD